MSETGCVQSRSTAFFGVVVDQIPDESGASTQTSVGDRGGELGDAAGVLAVHLAGLKPPG